VIRRQTIHDGHRREWVKLLTHFESRSVLPDDWLARSAAFLTRKRRWNGRYRNNSLRSIACQITLSGGRFMAATRRRYFFGRLVKRAAGPLAASAVAGRNNASQENGRGSQQIDARA
jgi:hypothetical protein